MEEFLGGSTSLASQDTEGGSFALDLFKTAKTSDDVLGCNYVEVTPQEAIFDEIKSLTFNLPQTNLPVYTALDEIYVSLTLSISKIDTTTMKKTPVEYSDNVRVVDRVQDCIWNRVRDYSYIRKFSPFNVFIFIISG